jgi:putative addiction module killer protein
MKNLKDLQSKVKILIRIQKLESDEHFGDCKVISDGIRELKINFGKGYRVYFKLKNDKIIILLVGGDKSTQQKDITKAKEIWEKLNN